MFNLNYSSDEDDGADPNLHFLPRKASSEVDKDDEREPKAAVEHPPEPQAVDAEAVDTTSADAAINTLPPFNVGDRVSARYLTTEFPVWQCRWYLGRISRVHQDGTYDVHYDDGDTETHVARRHIKESIIVQERVQPGSASAADPAHVELSAAPPQATDAAPPHEATGAPAAQAARLPTHAQGRKLYMSERAKSGYVGVRFTNGRWYAYRSISKSEQVLQVANR